MVASTAKPPESARDIISMLSQNATFSVYLCGQVRHVITIATNDFKMNNFVAAKESAYAAAEDLSFCTVHHASPISDSKPIVGLLLTMSVLSSAQVHMLGAHVSTLARYAKVLLTAYPSAHSVAFIQKMKKAGLLGAPTVAALKGGTPNRMSAVEVVKEENGNSFAFMHRYNKHILRVRGVVSLVDSDGMGGVNVALDGDPSNKDKGYNDFVYCSLSKGSENQALDINRGQTITMEGLFDPKAAVRHNDGLTLYPIYLLNCSIVKG